MERRFTGFGPLRRRARVCRRLHTPRTARAMTASAASDAEETTIVVSVDVPGAAAGVFAAGSAATNTASLCDVVGDADAEAVADVDGVDSGEGATDTEMGVDGVVEGDDADAEAVADVDGVDSGEGATDTVTGVDGVVEGDVDGELVSDDVADTEADNVVELLWDVETVAETDTVAVAERVVVVDAVTVVVEESDSDDDVLVETVAESVGVDDDD